MYKMIKQVYPLTIVGLHLALHYSFKVDTNCSSFRIWFARRAKSDSVGFVQPTIRTQNNWLHEMNIFEAEGNIFQA